MSLIDRFRKSPADPVGRVIMVCSVDEYIAGEQYDLPVAMADQFIAKGYAAGLMSRKYSAAEHAQLRGRVQAITFDPESGTWPVEEVL